MEVSEAPENDIACRLPPAVAYTIGCRLLLLLPTPSVAVSQRVWVERDRLCTACYFPPEPYCSAEWWAHVFLLDALSPFPNSWTPSRSTPPHHHHVRQGCCGTGTTKRLKPKRERAVTGSPTYGETSVNQEAQQKRRRRRRRRRRR